MNPRAAQVYKNFKQNEDRVLQSSQVQILQRRVKELETENKVLKNLLKEKL